MRSGGAARPSASASSSSAAGSCPGRPASGPARAPAISAGVARREGHQLAPLAALRHVEPDPSRPGASPRSASSSAASGRLDRHATSRRDRRRARVVLLDEAREHLVVRPPRRAFSSRNTSRPIVLPSRIANSWTAASLPDARSRARRARVRAKPAIFWVSIVRSIARTLSRRAAARSYSSRSEASPISRRERPRDLLLAALEEQHHLVDVLAVRRLVDGLDAGALAALDVVQQARPLRAPARPR